MNTQLLVRTAINRNDDISETIFNFAAGGRTDWTPADWQSVLDMLDATDLTIEEFML